MEKGILRSWRKSKDEWSQGGAAGLPVEVPIASYFMSDNKNSENKLRNKPDGISFSILWKEKQRAAQELARKRQSRLDRMSKQLSRMAESLKMMQSEHRKSDMREQMDESINKAIDDKVTPEFRKITRQFTDIGQRFNDMDKRLDGVNNMLSEIIKRLPKKIP